MAAVVVVSLKGVKSILKVKVKNAYIMVAELVVR
jgi:hypothetical protein